jgi:hypothetical protein
MEIIMYSETLEQLQHTTEYENYCLLGCDVVYSDSYQRFGGSCSLHLQDRRISRPRKKYGYGERGPESRP